MKVFEEEVTVDPKTVECEDGGMALIFNVEDDPTATSGMFVRLQSWDETKKHDVFSKLVGQRVRVTVQIIGDEN